jgi:hypothetical protein
MPAVVQMLRIVAIYYFFFEKETAIWQNTEKFALAKLVLHFTLGLLYSSWSVLMKPIAYVWRPNCDIGDANKMA